MSPVGKTNTYKVVWPEFFTEIRFLDKIAPWSPEARLRGESLFDLMEHLRCQPTFAAERVGTSSDGLPILQVSIPPFVVNFIIRGGYVVVLSYDPNDEGPSPGMTFGRAKIHLGFAASTMKCDIDAVSTRRVPSTLGYDEENCLIVILTTIVVFVVICESAAFTLIKWKYIKFAVFKISGREEKCGIYIGQLWNDLLGFFIVQINIVKLTAT